MCARGFVCVCVGRGGGGADNIQVKHDVNKQK